MMSSACRWTLILLMSLGPITMMGCSDDEEDDDTTTEPDCSANSDCAAGFFCSDGTCIEACQSSSDCAESEICVEGICEEDLSCMPGTCDNGLFCDDDMTCKALEEICATSGTCGCHVVNGLGGFMAEERPRLVATPGTAMEVNAVVVLREYRLLADAPFSAALSGDGFSLTGNQLEAGSGAGQATLTVTYTDSVSCEMDLVNLGTAPTTSGVRVYVYDDRTFEPISGARIIIDTNNDGLDDGEADDTSSSGVSSSASLGDADSYAVTVMAPGFHYTSVSGLSTSDAGDIAIPLTAKPDGGYGSGFSGRIDFDAFEASRGITREALVKLGLTSSSMPIKEILNFNMDLMLGHWPQTNCQNEPEHPDCHLIEIAGIQGEFHTTLPGGLSLAISGEPVKDHFDVSTLPGRRFAWGIGSEIEGADLIPMVGLFGKYLSDCDCNNTYDTCDEDDGGDMCDCDLDCGLDVDLGTVYDSLIPLLADVGIGFRGNISQPDRPSASWEEHRAEDYDSRAADPDYPRLDDGSSAAGMMLIDEMLSSFDSVTMPSLPTDPFATGQTMEAVLAITGVESGGFGFIPTGLGLGFDCTAENCTDRSSSVYDDSINGGVICNNSLDDEDNTCTEAMLAHAPEGVLPDGEIGIFHSPALSGMQGSSTLKRTLFMAVPMNELVRDFGTIRLSGLVHDSDGSLSSALSGRSFPTEFGVANNIQRRTYVPTSTTGLNYIRFSTDDQTRWHVYSVGSQGFTAPFVPEGWADPVSPQDGRSVVGVNHMNLGVEGVTLDGLASNNGTTLDRLFRHVTSLTMISQAIPAN